MRAEFGSRRELVSALGTSSGGHQLLLAALKPNDPRYASMPLAEAPGEDARLPYIVLCWPISDPLARYRMVKEKGNNRLVEAHDAYWASEAEMEEGNPLLILERGEAATPLPPAIVVQGTGDDNVTPDMADRFAAAYRARGGTARPAQIRRPAAHLHRARPGQRGLASGHRKAARFRAADRPAAPGHSAPGHSSVRAGLTALSCRSGRPLQAGGTPAVPNFVGHQRGPAASGSRRSSRP